MQFIAGLICDSRPNTALLAGFLCILLFPVNANSHEPASYVAGFARFADSTEAHDFELGMLLFGELGCASCHDTGALIDQIAPKSAPSLKEIAFRADPYFLAEYIAAPNRIHPGTTMPDVLSGDNREERSLAITHYLVSTSTQPFKRSAPDMVAIDRGHDLYSQVGCVACHIAKPGTDELDSLEKTSRPFPNLSAKYSLDGLRSFLRDPLHVRASGRMPSLRLSDGESRDIANYLLRDTKIDGPLAYEVFTGRRRDLNDPGEKIPYQTGITDRFALPKRVPRSRFSIRYGGQLRIDSAGTYKFHWQSSGALRLTIDGNVVTERSRAPDRNRIHQGTQEVQLSAGWLPIDLEYFEPRGTKTLQIQWEGPNIKRGEISAALLRHQMPTDKPLHPPKWKLNQNMVATGEKLFTSEGCSNCHDVDFVKNKRGLPIRREPELSDLNPTQGCLSSQPVGAPKYQLSDRQRRALGVFIRMAGAYETTPPKVETQIDRNLARLNCYACHERHGRGGITEAREPHFTCNEKDLGGEGRFPPTLTDVGYKLQLGWLSNVVENGASVRPYMNTRMPRFGGENVRDLAKRIAETDRKEERFVASPDPPDQAKRVGWRLTGKGKLQCISCHKFNNHDSAGLQALDLVTTTRRLNRQWFHQYMLNPAALSPGTRMP